ncbi:MAG: hypothetical protein ABI378_05090 [Chitinophagaceae bacterium]
MIHKILPAFLFVAFAFPASAQTTYLPLGQEDYHLLDKLETRQGFLDQNLYLADKPVSRKGAVKFLESVKDLDFGDGVNQGYVGLTDIDRYNIAHAISVSGEWAANGDGAIDSKHPWFKGAFYNKQPDLLHVKTPNFFMVANPVISFTGISEKTSRPSDPSTLLSSSRGVEVRARITDKIGLYTYFADNQEQLPSFVRDYALSHQAVPGADYYQTPSAKTFDYLQARGYVDIAAIKDIVNVTFGYDKHFIGDGIRSLFLSDFSSGATFLRLNTRIWKLNYQNLYLELTPQYTRGADQQLPHKYATMHHLSINATRWLNIGLFESTIFDRGNRYEFSYMNPVILYRAVERSNGSPDNENLGLNFKAIVARHLQFYGQVFFDEFKSKELFAGKGWVNNKFAVQLGGKYFDAFGIPNLDLQGEVNIVRPFTYSHSDTQANYTNYNQPLAHPLGAGFGEIIGVANYQPIRKLYLNATVMYYKQGLDSPIGGGAYTNFGSNIFDNYALHTPVNPADPDHGYGLINGVKTTTLSLSFNASYELRENLFIDLGATNRVMKYDDGTKPDFTSTYFYGGLRLNFARRDYNFY